MKKKFSIFLVCLFVLFFTTGVLSAGEKNKKGKEKYPEKTTSATQFEEIHLQPEEITPQVIELEPNKIQFQEITPKEEVIEEEPTQENFEVYVPQLQEITPQQFAKEREKKIKFEEFKPSTPSMKITSIKQPARKKYGTLEQTPQPIQQNITPTPQEVETFKPTAPKPQEVKPKVIVSAAPPPPPVEQPKKPFVPLAPPPTPTTPQIPTQVTPVQPPQIKIAMNTEYKQQLTQLAQQLAMLKERVLEAKTRIIAYGERLTKGFTSGTKVTIDCTNNLGDDFRIIRLQVFLDGHQVFLNEYSIDENPTGKIKIYRGSILPGKHQVEMKLLLRGDKGLFDFGYSAKIEIETGKFFTAQEGKIEHINVKLINKGGWFTPIEKKPAVKFQITEEESY